MLLNKCCCCVDLRTGAIILAVLGIVSSVSLCISGQAGWQDVIGLILGLITNGCLAFGAIKYNKTATLISVVVEMIYIVWLVIVLVLLIVWGSAATVASQSPNLNSDEKEPADVAVRLTWGVAAAYGCCLALEVYFWICIYSFYQALKGGSYSPA